MENDFISVIVPVYNVKRYLEACVMSILGQSYRHFELILVDDGSTDGSAPLCDDLAQRDNRIIVVHQKNGGVSSARNHGLAIMKGKYCTFVDADDIVEADWLKQLHAQITTTGAQLACCSYSIINRDGQKEPTPCHTEAVMNRNDALFLCMQPDGYRGQLWNKIFRSDIIQRNDLQMNVQLSMMEDMDFLVRYMQHTERVSFSAYPPYTITSFGATVPSARAQSSTCSTRAGASSRSSKHRLTRDVRSRYAGSSTPAWCFNCSAPSTSAPRQSVRHC